MPPTPSSTGGRTVSPPRFDFEARGESLEGQLAAAHVVMNRAASGRYPPDWWGVVQQRPIVSFVRHGQFPQADTNCDEVAQGRGEGESQPRTSVPSVAQNVLWYRAEFLCDPVVAPMNLPGSRTNQARTSSTRPDRKRFQEGREALRTPGSGAPSSFRRCLRKKIKFGFTRNSHRTF